MLATQTRLNAQLADTTATIEAQQLTNREINILQAYQNNVVESYNNVLAIRQQIAEHFKDIQKTIPTDIDCGRAFELYAHGKTEHCEQALFGIERSVDHYAAQIKYQRAQIAESRFEYSKAHYLYHQAAKTCPHNAHYLNQAALISYYLKRFNESEALFKHSIALMQSQNPDDAAIASVLYNLAALYQESNRLSEAEVALVQAITIQEKTLGISHIDLIPTINELINIYKKLGRIDQAIILATKNLNIAEEHASPPYQNLTHHLVESATLHAEVKKFSEAETLLRKNLSIAENINGKNHPSVIESLKLLADLYFIQNRYNNAEPLYTRALRIAVQAYGQSHLPLIEIYENIAQIFNKTGRKKRAQESLNKALEVVTNNFDINSPEYHVLEQRIKHTLNHIHPTAIPPVSG
ncbi:MAG: tetratricopeptide repeat protein [Pseudomonadota bacterium]